MTDLDNRYLKWKADRTTIGAPDGFTDDVMTQIHQDVTQRRLAMLQSRLSLNRLSGNWLARAGLVAAGVALGFLRWTIMARLLFG
jgi:hypothetical protein